MLERDLRWAMDAASWAREALGFVPDDWQAGVLCGGDERALLNCSRQSGKSATASLVALHTATYVPGSLVLLLSPSLRQSGELFRKVAGYYGQLEQPVPSDAETVLRLELRNGSRIISLPSSENTIRGYSNVNVIIVDEGSRVEDELFLAIRPMLAISRGRLIIMSTPSGKRGFFYDLWVGGEVWHRVKITAYQCPRITQAFLDDERRTMPGAFYRQEYECEFEENEGAVFLYDDLARMSRGDFKPLFGGVK